jgi:uncharacterized protein with ParB-like and HNH nuclease domain
MKIRSIDKDIKDILEGGYYRIPRFQRPYSWDRENLEDFWNDVIVDADADYFIGSMVVFKPQQSDILGVVDGQQRLTTITMMLAAVRNALKEAGLPDLASGTHRLIERPDINNKPQYVLQTETSYPFLQEFIQKDGPPQTTPGPGDEEDVLKFSFEYITEKISKTVQGIKTDATLNKKDKQAKIKETLTRVRDKILALKVIFIDLDDEDDAYLIFETLNTRGKDLTPSDLVKSHLTRLLKPTNKNVDVTKDKWNKMVELIEGSQADLAVTNLLHHYWLSRYEYVTVKKLYKDLKRKVTKQNAQEFLDSIVNDARVYRQIQETAFRKWAKTETAIRDSLDALNLFRVKQPLPVLLAIMHEYEERHLKQLHVEDILSAVEKFHFTFTAVTSQRSSGGISFMYALHARQLFSAAGLMAKVKELARLKAKLRTKTPSYDEFEANFVNLKYSRFFTKQKRLVHYVLSRLDKALANGGVPVDYSRTTIEHLAAENPPGGQQLSQEQVAGIGNLLLTEQKFNNKLANKSFAAKKAQLMKSRLTLDPVLSAAQTWGPAEIEQRAKWMAKQAYEKVWKL